MLFIYVASIYAVEAPEKLTERVGKVIRDELSEIWQFAEVAHGTFQPKFIFKNIKILNQEGGPLEN